MKSSKIFFLFVFILVGQLSNAQVLNTVTKDDGFCYAKLMTPDEYDTVSERVLIKAATTRTTKIPAEYNNVTESVMVSPEEIKLNVIPAKYQTVTEEIIDQPESIRYIYVPAEFKTVTEKVMVKEASKRYIAVPATYKTITETIEVTPQSKVIETIPAEYATVAETIESPEMEYRVEVVPAVYETKMEEIEIEPATVRLETLQPKFKTETEKVLLRAAHTKWVETKGDKNCLSADPNDCIVWCLVEIPAEYKTVTTRVNIGCDGSGVENSGCVKEIQVPAKYGQKSVRVLKTPATTRKIEVPTSNSIVVNKKIIKTPATTRERIIPAVYKTVNKQVVDQPASTKEEVIPAVYQDVTKKELVKAAYTKEEVIPATYKTISKRILAEPSKVVETVIPAVYENVTKRVLVTPESTNVEQIPAEYTNVSKRILKNSGDLRWRRIVCEKHQTPEMNRALQDALKAAGYDPGPSDNLFGGRTYAAMVQYQKDNDMWAGHLDYETAAALNLPLLPDAFQEINPQEGIAMPSNEIEEAPELLASKGGNNDDSKTTMSSNEMAMIDEINLMRSNPKAYVAHVKAHLDNVSKDSGLSASYKAEELAAGKELIAELEKLGPLPKLTPHEGLYNVGKQHGNYVKSQGKIGHKGADGSYPWDRVRKGTELSDGNENLVAGGNSVRESLMILLVDSGIPGAGHRKTLLDPKWNKCAVYNFGDVGGIPNGWIQMFGKK